MSRPRQTIEPSSPMIPPYAIFVTSLGGPEVLQAGAIDMPIAGPGQAPTCADHQTERGISWRIWNIRSRWT